MTKRHKKIFFVCNSCDFQIDLGSLGVGAFSPTARTLAAAEMNKHVSQNHPEPEFKRNPWGL
jgi:hypothetical protein